MLAASARRRDHSSGTSTREVVRGEDAEEGQAKARSRGPGPGPGEERAEFSEGQRVRAHGSERQDEGDGGHDAKVRQGETFQWRKGRCEAAARSPHIGPSVADGAEVDPPWQCLQHFGVAESGRSGRSGATPDVCAVTIPIRTIASCQRDAIASPRAQRAMRPTVVALQRGGGLRPPGALPAIQGWVPASRSGAAAKVDPPRWRGLRAALAPEGVVHLDSNFGPSP